MRHALNLTTSAACAALAICALAGQHRLLAADALDYQAELTTPVHGFDGKSTWVHARAGAIPPGAPGNPSKLPIVVMTLQKARLDRSDVFYGLCDLRTDDLGKTWVGPTEQPTLMRHKPRDGVEVVPCDFWPTWDPHSGKLLGTGATFWYDTATQDHLTDPLSETPYSAYDAAQRTWTEWKTLQMPDDPKFKFARAGCSQRVDLPGGEILLPVYFRRPDTKPDLYSSTICRCRFDGDTLSYVAHGTELTLEFGRGLNETSLVKFGDKFYLTLRNDERGYVTTGSDGMNFAPVQPWKFDDGADLGSYNTQTHWVAHSEGLFLVYTRSGANNDHIFRHRAPLFMAQVDPERLVVLRATERVVVPEQGASLGNFGITDVSQDESWIVTTEWMHPETSAPRGSDNSVFVVKLRWNRPNQRLARETP